MLDTICSKSLPLLPVIYQIMTCRVVISCESSAYNLSLFLTSSYKLTHLYPSVSHDMTHDSYVSSCMPCLLHLYLAILPLLPRVLSLPGSTTYTSYLAISHSAFYYTIIAIDVHTVYKYPITVFSVKKRQNWSLGGVFAIENLELLIYYEYCPLS